MTTTVNDPGLAWCPTCEQECVPMRNGTCGFCDTAVEPLKPKPAALQVKPRRGAGGPRRIPDAALRDLHLLHTGVKRLSMRELARRTYSRFDYSSPASCLQAIYDGWAALGLKPRGRIEMIREMQATSGLSPRDREKRRRRRQAAGITMKGTPRRPRCKGTTKRGNRCAQASMPSGYCWIHDRERLERAA